MLITIGGKERGIKFNELAIRKYSEVVMQDVANGLSNENDIAANGIYAMFWGGLIGSAYVKRETVDFTFENVCDWVEVLPSEVIKQVSDAFVESTQFKQLITRLKEVNGVKKKNPKQKQK